MPEMSAGQRGSGGWVSQAQRTRIALPWDDWPPLPGPDQSRYGPTGTTDSPRFWGDGVTRRHDKGDQK